jgi:hypothetical protein
VVPPAFNLGFAVLMEPNVKTLGSGIVANKPLPAGDAIRYETKPGFGGALTFSAGF